MVSASPFHSRVDVLYTARFGLVCLWETWERGRTAIHGSRYNGPELWLVQDGDDIMLQGTGDAVRVRYGSLQAEWRQFASRVRQLLKRLTPAFADPAAPRWGSPAMRSGGGLTSAAAWRAWLAGDDVPADWPVNYHDLWQRVVGDSEQMSTMADQQRASDALALRLLRGRWTLREERHR